MYSRERTSAWKTHRAVARPWAHLPIPNCWEQFMPFRRPVMSCGDISPTSVQLAEMLRSLGLRVLAPPSIS